MKLKITAVLCLSLFVVMNGSSQKDAGIKPLLNKAGELVLPTSVNAISTKIKVKGKVSQEGVSDQFCSWKTKSKLYITTEYAKANYISYVILEAEDKAVLSGLPYKLLLNKTTLTDCDILFKNNNPVKTQLDATESIPNGGSKLSLKKGKYYIILLFDDHDKLNMIQLATFDLEAAN